MADLTLSLKGDPTDLLRKLDMVAKGLEEVSKKLDRMADKSAAGAAKASTAFQKLGAGVERSMKRMTGAIERNAKRAALVLSAGLIGTMVKGVKAATEYEKSLAKVSTLLGKDAATKIPKYRQSILELSKTTGESVDVLADSLFTIISATVKGSETVAGSNKLLEATAKLAIAGFTDTATATKALTTALNSYNLGADEAVSVSDKLTKIAALANTTFGEMAPELGKIASVTAAAGISIEELGFMFASLTAGGRKVNMAMTDMRALVNGLTKPSKALAKIYEENGIQSGAAAIKQMGLVKVLELIKRETGGTFENIQKVIEQQEAWAGASILLGERLEGAGAVIAEIGESAGSTDDAFKKMSDTFAFKSQQFKSKVNEILIRIGEKILPVLLEKLDEVTAWVEANSDEIVDFFKMVFDGFIAFGQFVIQHGKAIATGLAAIWATGKIAEYWKYLSWIVGGLGKVAKFAGTTGLLAKGGAVAAAASPAIGGAGALLMAQEAQEEGKALAKKYGEDWGDIAESIGRGISDLTTQQLEQIQQGSIGFKQLEDHATMVFKQLREGAAPTFAQEAKMRDVIKRMVEAQKEAKARADREAFEKEFADAEEIEGKKKDAGKKTIAILSEEQKKALEKLQKEREAAALILRRLEIQAMDETAQVRARAEDDIADLQETKFKNAADRERAIFLRKQQMEKDLEDLEKKRIDKIIKAEEKVAKLRQAEEEKTRELAAKAAKEGLDAARQAFEYKQEAAREAIEVERQAEEERLANIARWRDMMIDALTGIANTIGNELDSMFGAIYKKAWEQVKELVSKAISAAAEGEKLLVLTDEERARLERERGRALNDDEARALATAMTPEELNAAEREGRIGGYEVTGRDTPENRMLAVLEQMQAWWANLAQNLGPILDWLTETAVPRLISSIIAQAPRIIEALNESWKTALPAIVNLIADYLGDILEQIPSIAEALIQGIVNLLEQLMNRLPDILAAVFRFLTDSFTSLVGTIISLVFQGIPQIVGALIKAIPEIVANLVKELAVRLLPEMAKAIGKAISDALAGGPFGKSKGGKAANAGLAIATGGISMLFHQGGMIADALRAHDGMFIAPGLAPGEVPIIAKVGESVLNEQATQAAGGREGIEAMNEGRGPAGGDVMNVYLSPEYMLARDARAEVDALVGAMVETGKGKVAAALRAGSIAGFKAKRN